MLCTGLKIALHEGKYSLDSVFYEFTEDGYRALENEDVLIDDENNFEILCEDVGCNYQKFENFDPVNITTNVRLFAGGSVYGLIDRCTSTVYGESNVSSSIISLGYVPLIFFQFDVEDYMYWPDSWIREMVKNGIPIVKEESLPDITLLYNCRNNVRNRNKGLVLSHLDSQILKYAENVINIAEENILLDQNIINKCQQSYSYRNLGDTAKQNVNKYTLEYDLRQRLSNLKGREKKEKEKLIESFEKKYSDFSRILDNFVDVIAEEKYMRRYMAKAVAWEAIQQKAVEIYSRNWESSFDTLLERNFYQISKETTNAKDIIEEYVKEVWMCDSIDLDSVWKLLLFFILHKTASPEEYNLSKAFDGFYEYLEDIKVRFESDMIKNKLHAKQTRKVAKYSIDDIDLMTGSEFEEFVAMLFKKMGYSTEVTKASGDQGIDVLAERNGNKIGIQVKRYSGAVGNSAVQEAVAGKKFYGCDKVIVVCNNYFTPAAIDLADTNDVVLWNRDMIKEKIRDLL